MYRIANVSLLRSVYIVNIYPYLFAFERCNSMKSISFLYKVVSFLVNVLRLVLLENDVGQWSEMMFTLQVR